MRMTTTTKIGELMTQAPLIIAPDVPVWRAAETMREHRVQHLPVQRAGELVGLLALRDIDDALASRVGAGELHVGALMRHRPYAVAADAPMREVLAAMVDAGHGSAVIVNAAKRAIGIFTAIDAFRLLNEACQENEKRACAGACGGN